MPLVIALTEILCPKNACCRHRAKTRKIVHKNQLIDNGNSRHLLRSQLSDHNIIQKTHKICDCIL